MNETDLNTQLTAEKTYWEKLNGASMVDRDQIEFSIPPSPSLPFTENFVLQSASRLLLNSFEWIKASNNAFKLLDIDVQTVLLQKNWFDLFALSMSQCAKNLSLSTILTNINYQFQSNFNQGKIDRTKFLMIKEQLFYLQTFISECEHLNITSIEYAYLKLISLFDFDSLSLNFFILSQDSVHNNLVNSADTNQQQQQQQSLAAAQKILCHKDQIKAFRVLACKELREKISQNNDVERLERLLLRISSLKKMSTPLMEELFFNDAIGNVQIEGLIPSIIGSNANESQDH